MKNKKSSIFRTIKEKAPTKTETIFMGIVFVSFSLIFLSGSFNNETKIEKYSIDIANVVKKDKHAYFLCENNEGKTFTNKEGLSKYLNDQFYLTSPFKNIIGYNFDKNVKCSIDELGELGTNPSVLTSSYFSNHEDDEKIIFDRYYFELLFSPTNTSRPEGIDNFAYITKTQADYLISNNPTFSEYSDVIDSTLTINIDGEKTQKWKISNIINDDCLFCDKSKSIFNNYIVAYTLVPLTLKNTESMLFYMSDFAYSNIDYITTIELNFPVDSYTFFLHNSEDNLALFRLVNYLNTRKQSIASNIIGWFLLVLFSSHFVALGYLAFKKNITLKVIIEFCIPSMLSWFLFFIISRLSKSILFFSFVSLSFFFIVFLLFIIYLFVLVLLEKYGKKNTIA